VKSFAALWLPVAIGVFVGCGARATGPLPEWWDNDIGKAAVVVPGFAPVRADGTRVELWGRRYEWDRSFLPVRIESLGRRLTGALELVALVDGKRTVLRAGAVEIVEARPVAVVVRATGTPIPGLRAPATTRVEYDGVAQVTLELEPTQPVTVGGLVNEVAIARNEWTRAVAFQATQNPNDAYNARNVMKQDALLKTPARGPFRNVLGFPDGDRSFWWFADNAEGWIWNGPVVTEVIEQPRDYLLRQHLIGAEWRIEKPMTFRFNFLATPVRDMGSEWREERVTSRPPEDSGEQGKYNFWWQDAFAHPVLPYSVVPPGLSPENPDKDFDPRPARPEVRRAMRAYAARGFQRIPYFSSHCIAEFDPAFARFREQWELSPPFPARWGTTPTPCVSHRAPGYTNYLLHRFSALIDEIETPGLYFDQAMVFDSRNPHHGAWTDSNGRTQASLDVLAHREFLKRLRVLFFEKGQPGTIVTHNSGSQVIPALTFTSTNLDGEQFRQPHRIRNDDYVASIPLDEFRSLYAGGQYGVRDTWLPSMWARHAKSPNWEGSAAQLRAYRSEMALLLLHDTQMIPVGVPRKDYDAMNAWLDAFGVGESDFVGYWSPDGAVRAQQADAPISYYRRADRSAALLVVANVGAATRSLDVAVDAARLGLRGGSWTWAVLPQPPKPLAEGGTISVTVPKSDFALVEIRSGG